MRSGRRNPGEIQNPKTEIPNVSAEAVSSFEFGICPDVQDSADERESESGIYSFRFLDSDLFSDLFNRDFDDMHHLIPH